MKDSLLKYFQIKFSLIAALFLIFCSCKTEVKHIKAVYFDFCEKIHCSDSAKLSQVFHNFDTVMNSKSGAYVLEDGDGSMIARAWLSEHAEKSIDIQYFIFSVDNVGLIACDYLVRAADKGIKVRILVDDIMVEADPEDIMTLDNHENIEIKIYNPGSNLGKNIGQKLVKIAKDFRGFNQRMHNKTFIVDGKVVITGGRNIADEYFDYDHEYNFRDRDILLLGKIGQEVQNSFNQFWESPLSIPVSQEIQSKQTTPSNFELLHQYACNPNNFWPQVRTRIQNLPQTFEKIQSTGALIWSDSIQFISDIPGKNKAKKGLKGGGNTTNALIELVQNAKESIDIQSPYLITTELSRSLFKTATSKGVKIRILTNSLASTDNVQAFGGYQKDRASLLKTGVEIYEFRPDAAERFKIMTGSLQKEMNYTPIFGLHAKSMVVDGKIAVIGTFNLDPRSANLNTECITIVKNEALAQRVQKGMEIEFKPENSWHTTLEWNPDDKVNWTKRAKTNLFKVVPKGIL